MVGVLTVPLKGTRYSFIQVYDATDSHPLIERQELFISYYTVKICVDTSWMATLYIYSFITTSQAQSQPLTFKTMFRLGDYP